MSKNVYNILERSVCKTKSLNMYREKKDQKEETLVISGRDIANYHCLFFFLLVYICHIFCNKHVLLL